MTDRTRILSLVGAVALIVVVIGVVAVFGVQPYPALPTVAEQPDPPVTGRLAYVAYEGGEGPCLHVVQGDGRDEELGCGTDYEGEIYWVDDGRLGVRRFRERDTSTVDVLDVATGELLEEREVASTTPVPGLDRTNDAGDRVATDARAGRATVTVTPDDGEREVVLELDGPSGYAFVDVGWTGDGRWIAVLDSAGRVIAVDPQGEAVARIWAVDIGYFVVR